MNARGPARRTGPVTPAWLLALGLVCGSAPAAGQEPAGPSPLERALAASDTLQIEAVAADVAHAYAWDRRGPWAIHVLEVGLSSCTGMAAKKAGPPITARATTSSLAADALAGVNADFFRIPEGTTVGAHVEGGAVVVSPGDRPIFAVAAGGRLWIGAAELRGTATVGAATLPIGYVNTPGSAESGLALFDVWYGEPVQADTGGVVVRVSPGPVGAGTTAQVHAPGESVTTDEGSIVMSGLPEPAPAVGAPVRWEVHVRPRGSAGPELAALEAVGGFPVLVEAGRPSPAILDTPESFGPARHPRTAVGYEEGGTTVLLVTVDGRQAPYSDGMTLAELADLMLRLGAVEALNLDGGGSTTMVVGGRIVNRPSDATGERPVGNALLVRSECN